jgi:hypothetical protein
MKQKELGLSMSVDLRIKNRLQSLLAQQEEDICAQRMGSDEKVAISELIKFLTEEEYQHAYNIIDLDLYNHENARKLRDLLSSR